MLRYSFPLLFLALLSCASQPKARPELNGDVNNKKLSNEAGEELLKFSQAPHIIARELSKQMPGPGNARVGVLNFTDLKGEESPEGKLLAEKLISELTSLDGITVVEREHLSKIIDEQKLNMSGVTTETGQEAGTVLSVDVLLSGTVGAAAGADGKSEITAKITDVKTGEIYGAISLETEADAAIDAGGNTARVPERDYPARVKARAGETAEERVLLTPGIRAELSALERRDPAGFHRTKKFLHTLKLMKDRRPGLFILVTEPPGSRKLVRLEKNNPRRFRKLKKIRKRLFSTLHRIPSLRPKLQMYRRAALAQVTGRHGRKRR